MDNSHRFFVVVKRLTVGALYIAGMPAGSDTRGLFNGLLIWGLSMSLVGALICWLLFGVRSI